MINAAGVLFYHAPTKSALFLLRGEHSDYPGHYCFPGGSAEDDETPEETAVREVVEEVGFLPKGKRAQLTRSVNTFPAASPPTPPAAGDAGAAAVPPIPPAAAAPVPTEVSFVTFLQPVKDQFEPEIEALHGEHVGYAWAPVTQPPQPLHPGCRVALARITMDELGVARAIVSGDLESPQRYENVTLFDIRITGTDTAYRKKLDEHSYRPPDIFTSPDFLARCNGLPVIMEHPEKTATLNSKEYNDRNIGSVFVPYVSDGVRHPPDEVWAIAKIYDDAAIRIMTESQMSTSPAVVFRDPDVNETLTLEDGSTLLIEGKPSLLDHIAICERGVWDKGGEPNGVVRGDSDMADEDKAKTDADAGVNVDKLLSDISCKLDGLGKRMDDYDEEDKKRKDGETESEDFEKKDAKSDAKSEDDDEEDDEEGDEVRRDKKRKDAVPEELKENEFKKDKRKDRKDEMPENFKKDRRKDDDEDEEERKDKRRDSRADSEPRLTEDAVRKLIADAQPRQEDIEELTSIQARADGAYTALGKRAPRFLTGESAQGYRKRLMGELKTYSAPWKDADIGAITDAVALTAIERQVYADAEHAGRHPVDIGDELRVIPRRDDAGRSITEFAGRPSTWMSQFGGSRRRVAGIRTKND